MMTKKDYKLQAYQNFNTDKFLEAANKAAK